VLTVLLVRHAHADHIGRRIAGRAQGLHLSPRGRAEAAALADALASLPIHAVYSGPLERARETAEPIAAALGLEVRTAAELDELDFGQWTGKTFEELADEPAWRAFNASRSSARIPGGETMAEAADRAMARLAALERVHPGGLVAGVTHGDVVRGVLLRSLGVSLDLVHRIEVAPASVSAVRLYDEMAPTVLAVNWQASGPATAP
jgi:probable phosphomutase (TIGR03848 family)